MAYKQFVVVAYDIVSDRKRKKVSDLLEEHGLRINKSVFELTVTVGELKLIKEGIGKLVRRKTDSVLFYYLCKECIQRNEYSGIVPRRDPIVRVV
jgi:CRISPR-associated protein Cas2